MVFKYVFLALIMFALNACSFKQANIQKSASIIFKTPKMKFYDKGFINKFDDYINLQIYNVGVLALNINIYEDKVCKNMFACMDSKEFNKNFINQSYKNSFLYDLFSKEKIYFKDKRNNVFIKVKYDKMPK